MQAAMQFKYATITTAGDIGLRNILIKIRGIRKRSPEEGGNLFFDAEMTIPVHSTLQTVRQALLGSYEFKANVYTLFDIPPGVRVKYKLAREMVIKRQGISATAWPADHNYVLAEDDKVFVIIKGDITRTASRLRKDAMAPVLTQSQKYFEFRHPERAMSARHTASQHAEHRRSEWEKLRQKIIRRDSIPREHASKIEEDAMAHITDELGSFKIGSGSAPGGQKYQTRRRRSISRRRKRSRSIAKRKRSSTRH